MVTPPTPQEAEIAGVAERLTKAQRRLLRAMPLNGAKKWRAVYRHAKIRHWTHLPFSLAVPTLTGSEVLTPLGRAVRDHLQRAQRER
jgi:uncharacterized membrane protein